MEKKSTFKESANDYLTHTSKNNGITLITLVITIVILLILSGIAIISLTGENGLLSRAKEAKLKENESTAKEKLQLILMNANIDKETKTEYNKDEYLTKLFETEGMIVTGDVITVVGWNFKIDREKLEILESQGESNITIAYKPKKYLGKNADGNYEMSILLTIESNVKMSNIVVTNPDGTISSSISSPDKLIIEIDKDIELDKKYIVTADTQDGKSFTREIMEESAEEIATTEGLVAFRDSVNNGLTYEGKTINLTDDIDLSSIGGSTIENWVPIGNATNRFKGTISGNGNSILGLKLTSNSPYQGFIGVNEGTIKEVNISSDSTAGSLGNCSGILCGENRGIIENCTSSGVFNYTSSTAGYWQGAICGFNDGGTIRNCANYGNIRGAGNVGGIAGGCGSGGVIINCLNTGNIHAAITYDAGGICGNASQDIGKAYFFNCYNTGSISCVNYNVGGITGMSTNETYLYNCYNVGNISSSRRCSISYWESTTPHLTNCFTLSTITNATRNDGATPKTINELKSQAMVKLLNDGIDMINGTSSTESPWTLDVQNSKGEWIYNNGYPILSWQLIKGEE